MDIKTDIKELLNNTQSEKRSIVFCETLFHLFNTLCVFLNYKNHAPVDIVFSDSSDFTQAKKVLQKKGPFENIYTINVKKRIKELWQDTTPQERELIAPEAGSYLPDIELTHTYSDLWLNLDTMASKMFYYKLLKYGMQPYIHFIDEGTSSYVLDLSASEKDFINHKALFGKFAFPKRVSDMWLHEPRIYSGGLKKYPIYQIPNQILKNPEVKELLTEIFGSCDIPSEKYIFFEESFAAESRTTNDIELFLEIAEVVGKENIIVKRHPRNPVNRFEKLGFKVMGQQSVPWEILLLNNNISDKVIISVGSSATLTPFLLYGMRPKAFLLNQLLIGRVPYLENPKMSNFFSRSVELFNQNSTNLYYPSSVKELQFAIKYVNNNFNTSDCDSPLFNTEDSFLYDPMYANVEEESVPCEELPQEVTFIPHDEKHKVIKEKLAKLQKPYMSIIVPVYNVEKYLKRCLNSLVFQTIDDIEIVVVNDGSPDNSQKIIDEYVAMFPQKIVPLKKENGGLSSAREFGLKHAKGKYVGFVDSDDYLDCNYCKKCLEALLYEDTKAVAFCVNHIYDNTIKPGKRPTDNTMRSLILDVAASFWAKVFDKEYLLQNAKFLNMWYEDIPVVNPMLSHLDKISIINDRLYYYMRDREDSITNKKADIRQLDILKAEKMAIENTNPIYRNYQIARSISRLITTNIDAFSDHIFQFIKNYRQELMCEDVRNNIPENILEKIDNILNDNLPKIASKIFIGAFGKTDEEKAEIKQRYSESVLYGCDNIIFIDENYCDVNENAVTKKLYDNGDFCTLSKYLSAKAIYENGGIAINDDFIFNNTLNKFLYSKAFFAFNTADSISDAIFGGEKGSDLFGKICEKFVKEDGKITVSECIGYYLVGEYGASLEDKTQYLNGINVYDSKVFIYKLDNTNVAILGNLIGDKFIKVPLCAYNNQVSYTINNFVPHNKWLKTNDRNKKLQEKIERRSERILELKEKNKSMKEKRSEYRNKISDLKQKNKTLKEENKKLKKKTKLLKLFPIRVFLKFYRLFKKIF